MKDPITMISWATYKLLLSYTNIVFISGDILHQDNIKKRESQLFSWLLAQSPSAFYYPSPWNNNDLSGGGDHVYHHLIHRGADNNHM